MTEETQNSAEIVLHDENGKFAKGHPKVGGIQKGQKHPLSPIGRIMEIWKENPEQFQSFVDGYLQDPNNRKHIVEMIDGKPGGDIVLGDKNTQNNVTFFGYSDMEGAFKFWLNKALEDAVEPDGTPIRPGCVKVLKENQEAIERLMG